MCKRVIGVENDVVEVEPRRSGITWSAESETFRPMEGRFVRVPKGHVWLAGDNLSNSTDSRTYGPVPLALVRGKAVAKVGFGDDNVEIERVADDRCGGMGGLLGDDWSRTCEIWDHHLRLLLGRLHDLDLARSELHHHHICIMTLASEHYSALLVLSALQTSYIQHLPFL